MHLVVLLSSFGQFSLLLLTSSPMCGYAICVHDTSALFVNDSHGEITGEYVVHNVCGDRSGKFNRTYTKIRWPGWKLLRVWKLVSPVRNIFLCVSKSVIGGKRIRQRILWQIASFERDELLGDAARYQTITNRTELPSPGIFPVINVLVSSSPKQMFESKQRQN